MAQNPSTDVGGENLESFLKPEDLLTPEGWQKAQRIAGRLPLSYEFSRRARREQLAQEADMLNVGRSSLVGSAIQAAKGVETGITELPEIALGAAATGASLLRQLGEGLGERRTLPPRVIIPGQPVAPRKPIPPGPISRGIAKAGGAIEEALEPPLEAARAATDYTEKKYGENLKPGPVDNIIGQFARTAAVSAPSGGAGFVGSRAAYGILNSVSASRRAANVANVFHMGMTGGQRLRAAESIGLGAASATGGATSAGSIYNDVYERLKSEGVSDQEARNLAAIPAGVSFVTTSLLTKMFGPRGVERTVALKTPKTLWKNKIKDVWEGFQMEASEEGVQELVDAFFAKMTYDPSMTAEQALNQVAAGFFFGGVLGAGVEGVMSAAYGRGQDKGQSGKPTVVSGDLTIDPDAGKNPEQLLMIHRKGESNVEGPPPPPMSETDRVILTRANALNDYWQRIQQADLRGELDDGQRQRAFDYYAKEAAVIEDMIIAANSGSTQQAADTANDQQSADEDIRSQMEGRDAGPIPEPASDITNPTIALLVQEEARIRARKAIETSPAAPVSLTRSDPYTERMYRLWLRDRVRENLGPVIHTSPEGTPLAPATEGSVDDLERRIQVAQNLQDEINRLLQRTADKQPAVEPIPNERMALTAPSPVTVDDLLSMSAAQLAAKAREVNHPGGPTGIALSIGHSLKTESDYRRIKAEYERINALMAKGEIPPGMTIDEVVDLGAKASILGEAWKAADGSDVELAKYPEYKAPLPELEGTPTAPATAQAQRPLSSVEEAQKKVDAAESRYEFSQMLMDAKAAQIEELKALAKGETKGDYSPSEYRDRLTKRMQELKADRARTAADKEELRVQRQRLAELQKVTTPVSEDITREELEQAAAFAQEKGSLRAPNLRQKFKGWSMRKATEVLKRLAAEGVVNRPSKFGQPYVISERGAGALLPPPPTQVTLPEQTEPAAATAEEIQAPAEAAQEPEPTPVISEHVIPTPPAPDAPAISEEQQSIIDGLEDADKKLASWQAELEGKIRQRMSEGRTNLLGDARLLALQTEYVVALFSRGIVRASRVAAIMVRRFGTSVIPNIKTAYLRAKERFLGKEALDTEAQIDKVLEEQSYRFLWTKDEQNALLGNPLPTRAHLMATLPKIPLKYDRNFVSTPTNKLAAHFWEAIHLWFVQQPSDYRPKPDRSDVPVWGTMSEYQRWWKNTQAATIPPAKARAIYDDLLTSYLMWRDATVASRHVAASDKAVIDRSKYPTQDIVYDKKPLTLEAWLGLRSDQMDRLASEHGIGADGLALAVGRQMIRTEKDIDAAIKEWRQSRSRQFDALMSGDTAVANRNAEKYELLQTAVEAATGQGKMADSLVKDPSYEPNVNQTIDFTALIKETVQETKQRINDPYIPAPKVEQNWPSVTDLRSQMIEQAIFVHGLDGFFNWTRTQNLNAAEVAYAASLVKSMKKAVEQGRPGNVVTKVMRDDAFDAAESRGYAPIPGEQKPRTPTLYGAPQNSPVGKHLYRSVTKLKNGTRTVAIEQDHAAFPTVLGVTYEITADFANTVDHVIITSNGSFAGFRGFSPSMTPADIDSIFSLIKISKPSREYISVPVSEMTRYRWRGITDPKKTRSFSEIMPQVTNMTQDEADNLLQLVEAFEGNDSARVLISNFNYDIYHQSYGVFEKDKETGAPVKEYERKQPKFVTAMMNLRGRVLFGDTFVKDSVSYQMVSIPGLIKPIAVPIDGLITRDAVYAQFVNMITDALTNRAVQVLTRKDMGVRTSKVFVRTMDTDEMYTPQLGVGVRVKVNRGGVSVDGTIVSVRDVAITTKVGAARLGVGSEVFVTFGPEKIQARGVVTGITEKLVGKVQVETDEGTEAREVYDDVYEVEAQVGGKQIQLKEVPKSEIRLVTKKAPIGVQSLYDVQVTSGEKPNVITGVFENELSAIPNRLFAGDARARFRVIEPDPASLGAADPTIFDGEPFVSRQLLGIELRHIKQASVNPSLRTKLNKILKVTHPKLILEALRKLRADEKKIEKIWEHLDVEDVKKTRSGKTITTIERVEAQSFPASISDFSSKDKSAHSKLASLFVDRVAELYENVVLVADANTRIKAYTARSALKARPTEQPGRYSTFLQKVQHTIKEEESRPRSQDEYIAKDITASEAQVIQDHLLPKKDAAKAMRYRLLNLKTFNKSNWVPKDGVKNKIIRTPMGHLLLRVNKSGRQLTHESKYRMNMGEDEGKYVTLEFAEAWLAVSGDEALIQVWSREKNRYETVYKVNLTALPKGAARPFTHTIKKEYTGQDKDMVVNGWYITPEVVANSAKNASGDSLWVKSDDIRSKYMSFEDYADYLQKTIAGNPAGILPGTGAAVKGDESEIETQPSPDLGPVESFEAVDFRSPDALASMSLPAPVKALFSQLKRGSFTAKGILVDLETGRINPHQDLAWQSVQERIADELIPGWRTIEDDVSMSERLDAIEAALDLYRQIKLKQTGVGSVSTEAPLVANIDQSLLNKPATGKQGIRELVANPNNGLTEESRTLTLALIDRLPEPMLRHLTFVIQSSSLIPGEPRVVYGGSFSHALRLARVLAGSANHKTAAEEIAHSVAEFLPQAERDIVEAERLAEIRRLRDDPNTPDNVREFLDFLYQSEGAITSEQFVSKNRSDWVDYYPLINTDEFFAHNLTEAARRTTNAKAMSGPIGWAMAWIKDFINAVKGWFNQFQSQKDVFFDNLLNDFSEGKFITSVNGGYLHEVNAMSDIAGVLSIMGGRDKIRAIARLDKGRDPVETGMALMGQGFTLHHVMMDIESQFTAQGEVLTGLTRSQVGIDNVANSVDAVRDFFPMALNDYQTGKLMLSDTMSNQMAIGSMGAIQWVERRAHRSKELAKKWNDKIQSDEFSRLLIEAGARTVKLANLEGVRAQIESALQASIKTAIANVRFQSAKSATYAGSIVELKRLQTLLESSEAITQMVSQMAQALAQTQTGFMMVMGDATLNPTQVLEAWLDTGPTTPPVNEDIASTAAWFLATQANVRHDIMANLLESDDKVLDAVPQLISKVARLMSKPNNSKAIKDALNLYGRAITNETKASFLLQQRMRKIRRLLNYANSMDQAARYLDQVTNHPAFLAWRKLVSDDVGLLHVPNAWKHVGLPRFGKDVLLPMPITKEVVTFSLKDNQTDFEIEQVKAVLCQRELDQWLSDPGNQNSPDAVYYRMWKDFCDYALNSSTFNDFQKIWPAGPELANRIVNEHTQVIDGVLRTKGNRGTQLMNEAMRLWRNSSLAMDKWSARFHKPIILKLTEAAESHQDTDDVDTSNPSIAIDEWWHKIGRELWSFSDAGYEFKAGDALPASGRIVTKQDIAALDLQVQAIDEALEIDATRGLSRFIPRTTVEDRFIPGVRYERRPLKTSRRQTVRVFNRDALSWTERYVVEGIKAGDLQRKRRLINENFEDVMLAFLVDRDSDHSKVGPLESLYPLAAQGIRDGSIQDMLDLENFFNQHFNNSLAAFLSDPLNSISIDITNNSGMAEFYDEFDALMTRIYSSMPKPNESAGASKFHGGFVIGQENSFTVGRGPKIAPYWWYNHGFQGDHSLLNFKLNGSSFYVEKVIEGFIEVKRLTEERLADMRRQVTAIQNAQGVSESEATGIYLKQNRIAIEKGNETAYYEELKTLEKSIEAIIENISKNWTQGGRVTQDDMVYANRVLGTIVGGVLASVNTLGRNYIQSGFSFNGQRISRLINNVPLAYGMAGYEIMKSFVVSVTYGPISLIYHAHKIHGVKAAIEAWKGIKKGISKVGMAAAYPFLTKQAKRKFWRTDYGVLKHLLRAEAEIVGDWVQESFESMFRLADHYRWMSDNGLMMPMNLRAELLAMANDPESFGIVSKGDAYRGGKSLLGMLVHRTGIPSLLKNIAGTLAFQVQLYRAVLPRAGDIGANVAGFNTALMAVRHLESHLRRRWQTHRDLTPPGAPVRLGKHITPADIVPSWFTEGRNMGSLAMIDKWFGHANLDLRETVDRFWEALDSAPDNEARKTVSLLKDEEAFTLAQSHIEELNLPTPANRPMKAREDFLNRVVYSLHGWRLNMASLQSQMFGSAAKKGVPVLDSRTGQVTIENYGIKARMRALASYLFYAVGALGIGGALGQGAFEEWARYVSMLLFGGEERSSRQVWERNTGWEAAKQFAADSSTILPYIDMGINTMFNDQPGRKSLRVGDPFVLLNQVQNVMNYVSGVINTGDPGYGMGNLFRGLVPVTKIVINNMPQFQGRVRHMNATRLLVRHGDTELLRERDIVGTVMAGSLATEMTPFYDRMINAAMLDDYSGLMEQFVMSVERYKEVKQVDDQTARQRVRSGYSSRNPYTRAFRRLPTAAERQDILNRMSESQRIEVLAAEERFRRGAQQIGTDVNFTQEEASGTKATQLPAYMPTSIQRMQQRGYVPPSVLRMQERMQERQNRLTPQASRLQ